MSIDTFWKSSEYASGKNSMNSSDIQDNHENFISQNNENDIEKSIRFTIVKESK